MSSRRHLSPLRGAVVLAVWAIALGSIMGCTSAPSSAPGGVTTGAVASPGVANGSAEPAACLRPASAVQPLPAMAPVEAVLRSRTEALADGSRARWLGPVAGLSLREQQGRIFDRMRSLGVTGLRLVSVTEPSSPSAPTSSTGSTTGSRGPAQPTVRPPSSTLQARARFAYRISGFDTVDRTFDINVSLKCSTAAHEHPQVETWTPYDRPQPWDLPDLTVRRSATSLVLAGNPQQAADLLARAESAQANVAAVWGRSRPAVWIAPPTDSEAALLLGRDPADPSALHDVAAVTDGPLQPSRPAGADRIVIVPTVWSSLPGRGRDVVATHELTHVVVRGSTTGPVPLWLSEGFAEFVAYRTVALPEHDIVRPALEAARLEGLPTGLPSDTEFDPATGSVAAAYGRSLLVLRTLADRDGVAALVRFYREVADPTDQARPARAPARVDADQHEAVDAALLAVLHTDRAALVRSWRARIGQLLS